jgi:hypothetical protein
MNKHLAPTIAALAVVGLVGVIVWKVGWAERRGPRLAGPPDPTVVLSDPAVGERPEAPADAHHLVMVIGCTLRRDQLSIYGGHPLITPTLDRLAAEGAVFDDAISAAPWTRAASAALLTGRHAVSVGMVEPGPNRNERVLPSEVLTFAEHLRDHGYSTVGFTANPNLNAVFGFHQGFDQYRQPEHLWRRNGLKVYSKHSVPRILSLVDGALEHARPLYLQVMWIDQHAPYTKATDKEREQLSGDGVPQHVAGYRAMVRRFDASIGALLEGLEARGLNANNTVVAVVNDHGEGLNWPAHHGKSHGRFLAPSAVGGVWVVRGPGVAAGGRVGGMASQVDVAPTLLDLAGVPGGLGVGMSHSAALAAGGASRTVRKAAYADTWFLDVDRAAMYTDSHACQRSFDIDVVADSPDPFFQEGCFDRVADPQHEQPLRDLQREHALVGWRKARVRELRHAAVEERAADPDLDRQLEALGYLERAE